MLASEVQLLQRCIWRVILEIWPGFEMGGSWTPGKLTLGGGRTWCCDCHQPDVGELGARHLYRLHRGGRCRGLGLDCFGGGCDTRRAGRLALSLQGRLDLNWLRLLDSVCCLGTDRLQSYTISPTIVTNELKVAKYSLLVIPTKVACLLTYSLKHAGFV